MRYEFYRDREVAFEGFTAGSYLFREEFTSRVWATRYDFPAFKDGRVKRSVIPDDTPSGAQGWFINTRRAKFKDRRLREALIDAFDFEWTNKNLMYGSYERTQSVFENSPMKAVGLPGAAELKLLEPFRGKVPEEVFGAPYVPPVTDGSGHDRRWLRRGAQLLTAAGYPIKDRKRVMPDGTPITIEFLIDDPTFKPHHLAYIRNLAILGFDASLARGRSVAIPAPAQQFRFRHHGRALQLLRHARRFAAHLFFLASGGDQGLAEPRRHRRSGHRRADRRGHRRPDRATN